MRLRFKKDDNMRDNGIKEMEYEELQRKTEEKNNTIATI